MPSDEGNSYPLSEFFYFSPGGMEPSREQPVRWGRGKGQRKGQRKGRPIAKIPMLSAENQHKGKGRIAEPGEAIGV